MAPECQEKNLKSLTLVAVGVNKSAEQYLLLDDETRDDLARGKFHDQRRGSFGTSVPSAGSAARPSAEPRDRHRPDPAPSVPGPPRPVPADPAPPVVQVPGEAGAALQRAGPPPRRDRAEARPEHLPGHPDHPDLQEPRQALTRAQRQRLPPTPHPPQSAHHSDATSSWSEQPRCHIVVVPASPRRGERDQRARHAAWQQSRVRGGAMWHRPAYNRMQPGQCGIDPHTTGTLSHRAGAEAVIPPRTG